MDYLSILDWCFKIIYLQLKKYWTKYRSLRDTMVYAKFWWQSASNFDALVSSTEILSQPHEWKVMNPTCFQLTQSKDLERDRNTLSVFPVLQALYGCLKYISNCITCGNPFMKSRNPNCFDERMLNLLRNLISFSKKQFSKHFSQNLTNRDGTIIS